MRIVMVGTGYVGLVTGSCFAEVGHDVICVDSNAEKVKMLKEGRSPIFEPGLEGMITRNMAHDRLNFSTDLKSALNDTQVAFIAVGTPEGEDGSADLKYVKAVAKSLGQLIEKDVVIIVKSTVPVGTCDMVEQVIDEELAKRQSQVKVIVASNPEFLKEGNAIQDFMRPDRVVVGLNDPSVTRIFTDMYHPFILDDEGKLLFMDRRSSELTKYSANAMLATRISFMNELAVLCESIGANIDKVRMGIGADIRIGRKFLYAGPGYGGSCFPKDVAALIRTGEAAGVNLRVANAVTEANKYQRTFIFDKIKRSIGDLKGVTIAVWGLTFKPGTDDIREAPSKNLIHQLITHGARVVAHDPEGIANFSADYGDSPQLSFVEDSYEALREADAVVLMTEWSEYRHPNWARVALLMRNRRVFDFRNQYDGIELTNLGFGYESIGRPHSSHLGFISQSEIKNVLNAGHLGSNAENSL